MLKQSDLNKISRVNHDVIKHYDLDSIGCTSLCAVTFDVINNEWKQTATDSAFIPEIIEKRLDIAGAPLLREKQGELDELEGWSYEDRIYGQRKSVETIITKLTPIGYQEIIVTTEKPLNKPELQSLDKVFYEIHAAVNEGTRDIIFPQIRAMGVVMDLHKKHIMGTLTTKDKIQADKGRFLFGDLRLSINEMNFIRGVLLGYTACQHEFSSQTYTRIKNQLIKKTESKNLPELMRKMKAYGVIQFLLEHYI